MIKIHTSEEVSTWDVGFDCEDMLLVVDKFKLTGQPWRDYRFSIVAGGLLGCVTAKDGRSYVIGVLTRGVGNNDSDFYIYATHRYGQRFECTSLTPDEVIRLFSTYVDWLEEEE